MKASRLLLTILCATAVFAIGIVVWQARTIRSLRAERAALRQDLEIALATGLDKAPVSAADQSRQGQLELTKLRQDKLDLWKADVEAGRMLEFGANLNY